MDNPALWIAMAVGAVQVITTLGLPVGGWYLRKQVDRIDRIEERVARLEAADQVFDVRLQSAATAEAMRQVMREELDRALKNIEERLSRLEAQGASPRSGT